ncbi:MAG: fibronectin type III domain-containing protein, partial [Eubacteriales bacterium]|nr:fibronectin type III domain-containing protein [Eubacteriales bacterium]
VAGAKGYIVYRKAGNESSWTTIANIKNGQTVTYKDTKATTNGSKYTYAVRAYFGGFKGAYAAKAYYRLGTHKISSVTNNAAGTITVKWNQNGHATGYQVRYKNGSTDKTVTIKSNKTLNTVIKSLKKGQTYNVYVRGYLNADGVNYYSAWSAAKAIKISK